MEKKVRFKSDEELEEEEVILAIKARGPDGVPLGGIISRGESCRRGGDSKRYVCIGNPYEEIPTVVKLETTATPEEIEAIRREIIPMKESYDILTAMALTYEAKQPLLLEGPTAVGKTFLVEKFTQLLHGRKIKPLEFYCNGQTDASELNAKWVPKVTTQEERKRWAELLESSYAREEILNIVGELEGREGISQEHKWAAIHRRICDLVRSHGFGDETRWVFEYGAIPKAMGYACGADGSTICNERAGSGFILHIEEVGLAEPQIIDCLLQLRGSRGRLAESIRLWAREEMTIERGPRFWIVFSTNPPEDYPSRHEVDPALARGAVFKRIHDLSTDSLRLAADHIFTDRLGVKRREEPEGCIINIYRHHEIGVELARTVSLFHNDLNTELKRGERGRQQRIPLTLDDMYRVSEYLIRHQVRNRETGSLDLTETLARGLRFYYLDRLADLDLKETMERNLEQILEGDTGKTRFGGKVRTRREILEMLVDEAMRSRIDMGKASAEDQVQLTEALEQARRDFKNKLDEFMDNENVPQDVKDALVLGAG